MPSNFDLFSFMSVKVFTFFFSVPCITSVFCGILTLSCARLYEGMVDYQHVVAVHADVARRKKRNWAEVEEPHFGEVYMFHYLYHLEHAIKLREETNASFLCQ